MRNESFEFLLGVIRRSRSVADVHTITLGGLCGALADVMHLLPAENRDRIEAILAAKAARTAELCAVELNAGEGVRRE